MPTMSVLEGTGDYDGWSFVLFTPDQFTSAAGVVGILYEGSPPPWAETLPLAPAE
jgi:hypothetical protein